MNLMQLLLLGVGYKIVTSQMKPAAPAAAAPNTNPEGVVVPGFITPLQSGDSSWSSDQRARTSALSKQAVNINDVNDMDAAFLSEYYGADALPAESDPLTVGAKESRLSAANKKAQAYVRGEKNADAQVYAAEVQAEYYDVDDATQADVVKYKAKMQGIRDNEFAKDRALAARAEALAMDSDADTQRMNERRAKQHTKTLARSLEQPIDPNLDQAYLQGYSPQARRGFQKNPDMGFVDAQPVSLREGNFSQSEIVPADEFSNHLSDYDLGMRDYPKFSQVKNKNSDFSGILVNEGGSPDFSENEVINVSEDFGGRR